MSAYAQLRERMTEACSEAVDDLEVAAILEADGVTDALAKRQYGATDVFHLARQLRRDIPARPRPVDPGDGPWRPTPWRHLLRGFLFGVPAVCFLAVEQLSAGQRAAAVLAVSVLLSWAASQASAYLAHVRMSWGDHRAAVRLLRGSLLWAAAPVLVAVSATAALADAGPGVTLVALAQAGYLLAAGVVLTVGQERLLLVALAPGVVAALVGSVLGVVTSPPVLAGVAASVLFSVAAALYVTRGGPAVAPTQAELIDGLPHALFGAAVGGLVLVVPVSNVLLPGGVTDSGSLVALVPLSVSMGVGEWLLYRYRAATYRSLHRSHTLREFAVRSRLALLRLVGGYLAALLGLCVLMALFTGTGTPPPLLPLAGYAALGGALFMALLLMSFRLRRAAVVGCALALVVEVGVLTTSPSSRSIDPGALQLATATVLFLCLFGYAVVALRRAVRHY